MISQRVVVVNPTGLHARPASKFVAEAKKYQSSLIIKKSGKEINGKSIIQIMSAGISAGTEICLEAEGPDEADASGEDGGAVRTGEPCGGAQSGEDSGTGE